MEGRTRTVPLDIRLQIGYCDKAINNKETAYETETAYIYAHPARLLWGYIVQAIIANLAPLFFVVFQTAFDVSFEQIGRLILLTFGTQLVVDLLSVKFVDKIGYRAALVLAHICSVAGLVMLGTLPRLLPEPYVGLTASVIVYAVGEG